MWLQLHGIELAMHVIAVTSCYTIHYLYINFFIIGMPLAAYSYSYMVMSILQSVRRNLQTPVWLAVSVWTKDSQRSSSRTILELQEN